ATASGVHMLPLVIGLVVSQSLAGRWIANPRRVRPVLVAGMVVTVAGLLLLSTLDAGTGQLLLVGAFLVMGIGIGMVPMVALTAAQNAVPAGDIGAASAAVTFFRSIGAAFGVTVFGALLTDDIAHSTGPAFLWIAPLVAVGVVLAASLRPASR
ncbi:MAG TPA: MFS transporter, partial [Lentzea sp.]